MQSHRASDLDFRSGYKPRPASASNGILTTSDAHGASVPITNHHHDNPNIINQRATDVSPLPPSGILGDYNPATLSAHSMETLAFTAPGETTMPYMNQGFHGIGVQISQNYVNNLEILNAESYDDGRDALIAREATEMGLKHNDPTMPFGITSGPKIMFDLELEADGGEELDARSKRRKKQRIETHSGGDDDDDEARKKARGRPRVDTKDETAADRRRTQIRLAQRAYRHRKETTISSLEKRVQGLKGTKEEMGNIFTSLYDFAVGGGLLDREPEFGRYFQSTTQRLLALAKAPEAEEHHDEFGEIHDDKGESEGRKTKARKPSAKKLQEVTPPASESVNPWGGYTTLKDESHAKETDLEYQPEQQYRTRNEDLQIITRPTEDNASFPLDMMDLQQFRVEGPHIENYWQNFFPQSQPPLPNSYAYQECSFTRRIHRVATEKALKLATMANPSRPIARYHQVFGFCLLYESNEAIKARLKRLLARSTKDTLQEWQAPFVHVGGSGTYYPMHESDINGELMPKFRTGYSMGPFSSAVSQARDVLDDDMKCHFPGFEGEFFDANDVTLYLQSRGLHIPPMADFVTAKIDLLALTQTPGPKSSSRDNVTSNLSPQTPRSPVGRLLDGDNLGTGKSGSAMAISNTLNEVPDGLPHSLGYDGSWDNDTSSKDSNNFIDPIFRTTLDEYSRKSKTPVLSAAGSRYSEIRTVTVNVRALLDELVSRTVCLGRAPGFRPADVNTAIIAAVKAGY